MGWVPMLPYQMFLFNASLHITYNFARIARNKFESDAAEFET